MKDRDPEWLHGSHVVSGRELEETFSPELDDAAQGRRFRLRLRHAVVLVLLLILIVGGIGAVFSIQMGLLVLPQATSSPTPTSLCPAEPLTPLAPASVKVNVYNATTAAGLAAGVSDELKARKFVVGTVDNTTMNLKGPVAVISGADGHAAALAVQRQFPGADYYQDTRTDGSVDVILLPGYKEMAEAGKVSQAPGALLCPRGTATASPSASGR
ncbi:MULTISPECIES: LytR C-terminal domain-containing protein [Arthrobacter]|uniref:LytR C-terminal domain-containing protein n=2 Tax=Arthrobacter TaxID=1663 RepID=A0ABU9KHV9_9MICC|nr:LytR C-terminal domain-containing protein [Arthrobacter sp. YJM1]MDP5226513.1 LytR C-terminal domain-containing protein [Arthrobacter sp. YJM1]